MKKTGLLAFAFALTATTVFGQGRSCATMHNLERLQMADPGYAARMQEIETFTQNYLANHPAENNRAVVTIPVVVHVVYNTATQNISDAQIQSQIAVLNADYAATNSDKSQTPSAFSSLIANTNIQFCLAQRTPAGAATTGIVRKSTTSTSFIDDDKVKYAAQGGDDAWDATKYLNIWVCNLGGGLLGYAQFPGGANATDGVVINYTAFGNTGTAASPYNKGRTATHEVGHWLNLRHIWGDANCGSDLVNDTPTQQTSNYGCPTYPHVTCSNAGDMSMNYMDYTDDACMYMFTAGQSTRMNALFATGGARVGLTTSLGCQAPSGGGTTCATPTGLASSAITSTTATLSWTAVSGATSYTVGLKTSAATTYTNYTATTNSISFTGLTAATTYNFIVTTNCSSGSSTASTSSSFTTSAATTGCSDAYESNNTLSAAKTIATNTNITALIGTSTDVDYFKFTTTTTAKNIQVTLTNLPADYDLYLYNASGTLLAKSINGSTTSETLKYNTSSTGTFYVRVVGYGGVYSTTSCYTLKASVSSTAYRLEEGAAAVVAETELTYNVYPNPTSGLLNVDFVTDKTVENMQLAVYDLSGRMVHQEIIPAIEGKYRATLDLSAEQKGIYQVFLRSEGFSRVEKIVVY
ncbi:MAG: M43 family zinc metalloprotease [Chitinophagales bacterium]